MTGSRWRAAKFSASWRSPCEVEPSPPVTRTTPGPPGALQLEGDAGGVGELGADDRRVAEHPQAGQRPVVGHLAAAAAGVALLGEQAQEQLLGGHPQGDHEGDVAVVGDRPVHLAVEGQGGAHLGGLVPGRGDHEGHPPLAVQRPHAVVEAPGQHHQAVHVAHRLVAQPERQVVLCRVDADGHVVPSRCGVPHPAPSAGPGAVRDGQQVRPGPHHCAGTSAGCRSSGLAPRPVSTAVWCGDMPRSWAVCSTRSVLS